ncbi:MAG TPA: ATP-binding protein, partial [Leptospiraceae bacterium]|nr:ATP-binding protein [Leptospiraceae bacterium]
APYSSRKLKVVYSLNPRRLLIVVQDEGAGFNHTQIVKDNSMEANKKMHLHGRGITMAKSVFDSMRYNEKGNRVALLKRFRNQTPPTSPGSTIV